MIQKTFRLCLDDKNIPKELQEYSREIKDSYDALKMGDFCNDMIMNAAIYYKLQICESKGIKVEIDIQNMDRGKIKEIDLMSIVYNLFDNAREACERIQDLTQTKYIRFKCGCVKNQLIFEVKNSMPPGNYEKGMKTIKKNKEMHGNGLRIVDEIVEKYDGIKDIHTEEKMFQIMVALKIN